MDLHNLERKRWKSGRHGYFLSGVHYTKGDIILIHHGPHAGQGARVEAVNRVDRKLKQEYESGGQKIEDVEAKWDITVSLFNNRKQKAGVSPRQVSLFDPWTKQQRYHIQQPTLELAYAIMPDGEPSWEYFQQIAKEKEQAEKAKENQEPEEIEVELTSEQEEVEDDSEEGDLRSFSMESKLPNSPDLSNVSGETTETEKEVVELDVNNVQLLSSTSKRR